MSHIDPRELDVVAIITLRSDPRSFTDRELTAIREQIALLLHQQGSVNININIDDVMVEPKSGIDLSLFYLLVPELIFGLCLQATYTRTVLQIFYHRQIGKWLADSARNRSGCFIEK